MAPLESVNRQDSAIGVILVDDHAVVRQGTREMLAAEPRIELLGELSDGHQLSGLIRLKTPQVLLLDINLPDRNGLECLQEIRPQYPDLKILMFSAYGDIQYVRKALRCGANGYLTKTVNPTQLCRAIVDVVDGTKSEPVFSDDVAMLMAESDQQDRGGEVTLTPREEEILILVAQGMTNRDVAQTLHVSVKTVDSHVANVMKKLDSHNRSQLTAYAYEQGFL